MTRKREFERGLCEECGAPFLKKPRLKRFCRSRCKDAHNNRRRVSLMIDQMMTIGEAAQVSGRDYEQVRRLVRAGRLRSQRLFGRIVVYRDEVMRLK